MPDTISASLTSIRLNPDNPNTESPDVFNALCRSIERNGFVVPLQVWRLPNPEDGIEFEVIGGEHRYRAAQTLNFTDVPVVVMEAIKTKDDAVAAMVALNQIHGKMDPIKLTKQAAELVRKYGLEEAQHMLGFAAASDLEKLISEVKKTLTPEQRADLDRRRASIRSVDDLTLIVNELIEKHGKTIPIGYIMFQFGGKTHMMIEMTSSLKKTLKAFTQVVAIRESHVADCMESALVEWTAKNAPEAE